MIGRTEGQPTVKLYIDLLYTYSSGRFIFPVSFIATRNRYMCIVSRRLPIYVRSHISFITFYGLTFNCATPNLKLYSDTVLYMLLFLLFMLVNIEGGLSSSIEFRVQ